MQIKTVTGPTIQAALAEAREKLGDNVVLLESVPAEGGRPASIKVVLDPTPSAPVKPTPAPKSVLEPVGYGYGPQRRTHPTSGRATEASTATPRVVDGVRRTSDHFQPTAAPVRQRTTAPSGTTDQQLHTLQRRIQDLEKAIVSPSTRGRSSWQSVELLRALASQGLRTATLSRLFDRVQAFRAETGLGDGESVLIRNELRRMLQMPVLRPAPAAFLLVGSAGSGKTSLIQKLAMHDDYYGHRRASVVVIQPEDPALGGYGTLERYRQCGIAVQSVSTRDEMRQALDRVERFDHLLIDTPSLPVDPDAAASFSERIRDVVQDVVPLHVQLVLDASRVVSDATLSAWSSLSLRPASTAVTHLDESHQWGRFAEWLIALALPYGYASEGARVPTGLASLSASRIAEHLCATRA